MQARRDQPPEACEVHEENWPTVALFLDCSTQWRTAGMSGVPVGLDYAAVDLVARTTERTITPAMFAGLRVMEGAAIAEMAQMAAERARRR